MYVFTICKRLSVVDNVPYISSVLCLVLFRSTSLLSRVFLTDLRLAHFQMELVSGYRDRMIEFSEAMAQWYRCFQTTRRGRKEPHSDFWGYDFPRYHMDRSPYWILHLLDCAATPPAAIPRLEQTGVDLSELSE